MNGQSGKKGVQIEKKNKPHWFERLFLPFDKDMGKTLKSSNAKVAILPYLELSLRLWYSQAIHCVRRLQTSENKFDYPSLRFYYRRVKRNAKSETNW